MKKFISLLLTAVLAALCLTGCGETEPPIDIEGFETIMEAGGYTVRENPDAAAPGICDTAVVAYISDVSNVDYYLMADEDQARELFDSAHSQVEEMMEGKNLTSTVGSSMPHSGSYRVKSSEIHITLIRRGNVVIYARALPEQSEQMHQLLENMGF